MRSTNRLLQLYILLLLLLLLNAIKIREHHYFRHCQFKLLPQISHVFDLFMYLFVCLFVYLFIYLFSSFVRSFVR